MLSKFQKTARKIGRKSIKVWSIAIAVTLVGISAVNAAMDARLFEGMNARMIALSRRLMVRSAFLSV